jgi:hypothetical protein
MWSKACSLGFIGFPLKCLPHGRTNFQVPCGPALWHKAKAEERGKLCRSPLFWNSSWDEVSQTSRPEDLKRCTSSLEARDLGYGALQGLRTRDDKTPVAGAHGVRIDVRSSHPAKQSRSQRVRLQRPATWPLAQLVEHLRSSECMLSSSVPLPSLSCCELTVEHA